MSKPDNQQHKHHVSTGNATRSFALLFCLGALAGILIWAKLRLVTDIPRSAYAEPKEEQVDHDQYDAEPDAEIAPGSEHADQDAPIEKPKAQP